MTLVINDVSKRYGGLQAVGNVTLTAMPGEVTSVIGPNGAGKTTLLNIVSGTVVPDGGSLSLSGEDITAMPPHKLAKHGLTRTYQAPQLFEDMSVIETVKVGAHLNGNSSFWSAMIRAPAVAREETALEQRAQQALTRAGVPEATWKREAMDLPYGYQRRVEIARALAMRPKVLLLDEPAAGLNARETDEVAALIRSLADEGMIVVLVEHDMSIVMEISRKIVVMNFGTKIAEGTPPEVQSNQAVIDAYLGAPQIAENHAQAQ